MIRLILALTATAALVGPALADASCQATATEKKLAGAALASFMTKCTNDATAACQKVSGDKKLAGAAKASFEKKCIDDATTATPVKAAAPAAAPAPAAAAAPAPAAPAAVVPAAPAPKK